MENEHPKILPTTQKISVYEQSREERIKENLKRMEKLGIVELSLKLKSSSSPPTDGRRRNLLKTPPQTHVGPTPGPIRRSSRLQNVTQISYCEPKREKKENCLKVDYVFLEEGSRPEIYTEEHKKLLGSTDKTWELFVDGIGKDGKRIYDPIKGKTCHQCRQKTLGHRTQCSRCNMVQGQFCGDCLYMRYGEHVLEAVEDPNWICPVCRGICNCSLCRNAKGWAPTGPLYRKISRMGYKSVAHYLMLANRSEPSSKESNQTSTKRSLLTDMESIPLGSSPNVKHDHQSEDGKAVDPETNNDNQVSVKRSFSFSSVRPDSENDLTGRPNTDPISPSGQLKKQRYENHGEIVNEKALEVSENNNNSIAERLRPRRRKSNELDGTDDELKGEVKKIVSDFKKTTAAATTLCINISSSESSGEGKEKQGLEQSRKGKKAGLVVEPSPDSIAGRLRQRRGRADGHNMKALTPMNLVS